MWADNASAAAIYRFGVFELDVRNGALRREGAPVKLPPQPFKVLVGLVSRPGELVTREEIQTLIWGGEILVDFELGLNYCMSQIRRALGDSARTPRYVETVPRRGYRFIAAVEDVAPAPLQPAATTATPVRTGIRSIAVLPLENLSRDPEQEYFVGGMTDELITCLGRIRSLQVISRSSVMRYKKTNKRLPQIAKELNVDAVIEGAVLRVGNRVRITAQLIEGTSDVHLWAESYERDLKDILSMQAELAQSIAKEVSAEIARKEPAGQHPVNPDAYVLYLRGKMLARRATGTGTEPHRDADNLNAIKLFERAIEIDPGFAPAHAALAACCVQRIYGWESREEWKTRAEAAIAKALALDPDLPAAYLARANLVWTPATGWQHEEAIRECRQAQRLNPNLDEAHELLGVVYLHVGLIDEGLAEIQTAATFNPSLPDSTLFTGMGLLWKGDFENALPFLTPTSPSVNAYALWELGRKEEAWSEIRDLLRSDPRENDIWLACIHTLLLADAGESNEVEKRIREKVLEQGVRARPFGHFHHVTILLAMTYALMNRPGPALRWLEETAATGFPCYPSFETSHGFDPLRNEPSFIEFMKTQKQHWQRYKRL